MIFFQVAVPRLAAATLTRQLQEAAATNDVNLTMSSSPNALIGLGRVDNVSAVAHDAKLGEVYASELTLNGTDISFDVFTLLKDGRLDLRNATSLTLKGIFSEENLRELLSRKVDKLENVHVDITEDRVLMTADVKLFGKMAEAEVEGIVLEDSGALYFRMTHMNMRNALLGRLNLENFFGDILLVSADKLPLNLKIDEVKMQPGHITVTANRMGVQ